MMDLETSQAVSLQRAEWLLSCLQSNIRMLKWVSLLQSFLGNKFMRPIISLTVFCVGRPDPHENTTMNYGDHWLKETRETFRKWTNGLYGKVFDRDYMKGSTLIYAALFSAMLHINDRQYHFVDGSSEMEHVWREQNIHVEF